MKKIIEKLERNRGVLTEKINNINKALDALRDVCEHKHQDDSDAMELMHHDKDGKHYKCTICKCNKFVKYDIN